MITQLIATTLKAEQLAQQLIDAARRRNTATATFGEFKRDLLDILGPDDDPIVVDGGVVKARSGSPAKRVVDAAKVAQLCPKVASSLLGIAEQLRASAAAATVAATDAATFGRPQESAAHATAAADCSDAADAVVKQAQRLLRLPTKARKATAATLVVTLR